jgi:hypothetical protein
MKKLVFILAIAVFSLAIAAVQARQKTTKKKWNSVHRSDSTDNTSNSVSSTKEVQSF